MARHARGHDPAAARRHLARVDRPLGAWMRRIGPMPADKRWRQPFDPVDALARAILYQQLHAKAAATIVGRLELAIGSARLHDATLSSIDDAALRACGVSGNKALALRDLSRRERDGAIPTLRQMSWMDDDAIIDALVPIRGIGRWTVEMMLIFRLGRPDVFPVDDLGIRKGAQVVDGSEAMPSPRALRERGERWGPWRTQASLYLWRIADAATQQAAAVAKPDAARAAPVRRSQG